MADQTLRHVGKQILRGDQHYADAATPEIAAEIVAMEARAKAPGIIAALPQAGEAGEVTQADKDLFKRLVGGVDSEQSDWIDKGMAFTDEVHALARHRLSASARPSADFDSWLKRYVGKQDATTMRFRVDELRIAFEAGAGGLAERYRKALALVRELLFECELNMSNYDEAGVSFLNQCATGAYAIADKALASEEDA